MMRLDRLGASGPTFSKRTGAGVPLRPIARVPSPTWRRRGAVTPASATVANEMIVMATEVTRARLIIVAFLEMDEVVIWTGAGAAGARIALAVVRAAAVVGGDRRCGAKRGGFGEVNSRASSPFHLQAREARLYLSSIVRRAGRACECFHRHARSARVIHRQALPCSA